MSKPTIKEVAEKAGVSTATVSRALNEPRTVSADLREKVMEVVQKLDYKPSSTAKSLRTSKTRTIGLMISDNESPFYAKIMRGVEDVALENDYSLFVCNTDEELEKESLYLRKFQAKEVDGIIIAPTGQTNERLVDLNKEGLPIVFIDRWVNKLKGNTETILADNVMGSYKAVNHLIHRGHRRIGIITGVEKVTSSKERLQGYRKALKEVNINVKDELIAEGSYTMEGGGNAVKSLLSLKERPSAIFSTNGKMTMGALKQLRKNNYTCPDDLSLVSFDDFDWFSIINPPVTAVWQDSYEIGEKSGKILIDKIDSKSNDSINSTNHIHRVDTKLRIRNSVRDIDR